MRKEEKPKKKTENFSIKTKKAMCIQMDSIRRASLNGHLKTVTVGYAIAFLIESHIFCFVPDVLAPTSLAMAISSSLRKEVQILPLDAPFK